MSPINDLLKATTLKPWIKPDSIVRLCSSVDAVLEKEVNQDQVQQYKYFDSTLVFTGRRPSTFIAQQLEKSPAPPPMKFSTKHRYFQQQTYRNVFVSFETKFPHVQYVPLQKETEYRSQHKQSYPRMSTRYGIV